MKLQGQCSVKQIISQSPFCSLSMQVKAPSSVRFHHGVLLILILSFVSFSVFSQVERNAPHTLRQAVPTDAARVIVKFKQTSDLVRKHTLSANASANETLNTVTARANSLGARLGLSLKTGRAINEQMQVVSASGISGAALAKRLAADVDVEYAVVDQRRTHFAVPNDPLYAQGPATNGTTGGPAVGQWYLRASAGEVVSSINVPSAWAWTTGNPQVVVAVLDTGVRPEHPDFANRLLAGYDMVSDVSTANDGDARDADATDPGDWVTARESNNASGPFYMCGAEDSSWHGTNTASLIGATFNNGVGMAGVAGGVKLLPVRVLGKCGGYDSDIITGIQWAAGLTVPGLPINPTPARVINMSLGGSGACPLSYRDAINAISSKQDPAVIIASAGNTNGQAVSTPANCPGVIAVAGLRHSGTKVGYSDLGPEITVSAPAGNCVNTSVGSACLYPILAATNKGTTMPADSSYTDSFNTSLGTSFSAPLVAGTAALMLSVRPLLTPAEIKAALQSSARPFPSAYQNGAIPDCHAPDNGVQIECHCTTATCGAGMLDAAAAVAAVMPTTVVVEFYNTHLDHYFITADPGEAAAVDSGSAGPGWRRTGYTFKSRGVTSVCRFYGSQSPGPNSHFYTVDPGECNYLNQLQATTPATQKRWNFESLDFVSMAPVNGACPVGSSSVYRAYNNGFSRGVDSNHRITSSLAAMLEVVSRGWINEGVVMCAPN